MISFCKQLGTKFGHAIRGIVRATQTDKSFSAHVYIGIPTAVVVWYLGWPLTDLEFFMLVVAVLLVLVTELQNSAFEAALDRLHPELHEKIGRSKDMAAGAVLLSVSFAILVGIFILTT